ncbi:MAG: hypothetical protein JOZ37_11065 [Actinobacteria bacterium]|nr:hypothetical protein [Actinomycetota bacterium]
MKIGEAARARHPSTRWQPDTTLILEKLTERARTKGRTWPEMSAAMVLCRGLLDLDQDAFAALVGVTSRLVDDLETSRLGPASLPPSLAQTCPWVDWERLAHLDHYG